jgi:hypothetical protein
MLKRLYALAICGVVFSMMCVAASSKPHHQERYSQNTQAPETLGQQSKSNVPPIAQDNPNTGGQKKEERCQYGGPVWFAGFYCFFAANDKFWVSFGTLVLAAFTIILGAATVFLTGATRRLVREGKDTARRQLRAYVFLDPAKEFTFVRKPSTTHTTEVGIHVKNMGLTPAHDVEGHSWMDVNAWPLPANFSFVGPPGEDPVARSVVPPGGLIHFHTGTSRPFTAQELSQIQSAAWRVYIYGHIFYVDTFGCRHWTNFCQASTALGKEGFTTAMAKCDRHNDADRD